LQHALAEAEDDYRSILQAKEQTLRNANVATRARSVMRGDRDIAEKARDLYESFWTAPARTPRARRASGKAPLTEPHRAPASTSEHQRAPASTRIRRAHGRDRRCSGAVLDQEHRHDLSEPAPHRTGRLGARHHRGSLAP
jgi:hypothetical protein